MYYGVLRQWQDVLCCTYAEYYPTLFELQNPATNASDQNGGESTFVI